MNLHGLRILDFKTSHSKTVGDGALRKEPNVLVCENEENQKIDNKETSDLREADDQNVSHKTHKTASRKYSFLQRRTSSEIFKNPLQTKVKDQSPKNNSCEDLKVKFKNDKVNQHSRFNFFNKDSILNLHLKGGDIRRNKKRNKQEYDTTVLFDSVSRNKTSTKKPVKNEGMKQRKKNKLLDDTFGFLKNKRSITSCYRQNNKFMNLDQCLVGLKQFKKRKVNNTRVPSVFGGRSRHKNKVTKQCTCVHNPLKILTYESSGYSNIVTPNVHISDGNLGGKGAQEFKTGPGYKAPDNKTPSRNQKFPKVKSAFRNKAAKKKGSAAECKCPPSNYWEKQLESKIQMKKDAFVSVSSASLEPKIYCGCDAAVATDKSKLTTRKRSKTDYKCCQMKRNTPRVVADSCEPDENPQSHNFNTIKKERLEELVKEERNTFFTDFINDMVDFRVGQTKHRFPVQCMKYICLGLLVIVWSPCLLALFLGRVIMCPQRISCSLGGPQLMKQMQTNSNCTWNGKNKRSLNEIHRKEIPMNTPVNYVKCLPAACIKANLPTHSAAKRFKKFQDKSLPTECQQKKMHAHSLSKAKRKCLVTRDERPQESSNILMNYLRNRFPTSECPRSQKSNQRQKKFMSSVASWCTRTVASFSNVVSVVKLIGFRLPTGTRTSFIPSLNTTQRNRCSLYYGNGRGWIVKPQVIQNMRCEYSSDLRLSSSSKDCILKPKSKISFSEQPDCPSDCVYNRTRTSKVDPDSHFSTVLFGNYKTTNQQVNIKSKQLTTRIEHPSTRKEGELCNFKHQQTPSKRNMFNPHNEPNCVVVPLHGLVIGYPGGSGYYYPKEQTSEQNNKNKLLSIVKKKETYHKKPGYTVDKIAYNISQKSPIQSSDKILHSKSRQVKRASTNNSSCQRCLTSSKIRANKQWVHKCNYCLRNRQVNNQAKSTKAFDGAFQSSHTKHLVNAMKEKNRHPTRANFSKSDNTNKLRENMVSDKTGCNRSSVTQLKALQSAFCKSKKTPKPIVSFVETATRIEKDTKIYQSASKSDFINNRTSKLSSKESSKFHVSPKINTKNKYLQFERPFEKGSNSCKSIKKYRELPLNKVSEQSQNIRDQKQSPSFGTAKQKMITQSFGRASNIGQNNRIPIHNEKSLQPRGINTNLLLDKYVEHTSGTLLKQSQNVLCPSNQKDTCTAYCARDSIKGTVSSMSLFDPSQKRRNPVLTADFPYDKPCSNVRSLNSFQYQQFSEGLKKCIVMSKSRRHNQSNSTHYRTNKAPRYRCNSLYPGYGKQSTNLTEFDSFRKLAGPQNSKTYLRQKKQIQAYNTPQYFKSSYRKEFPLKSRPLMSLKNSLSSITDASSYSQLSLPSQKLSHYLNDNLTFSSRYSSSLCRKSIVMGKCDYSCTHTAGSFQSILCKFKSYDEYEYKDKQKLSLRIPYEPIFKQKLQLYLNLKNNTIEKSRRSPCASSSKKLQVRKKPKLIAHKCENNSVITKNQLKTSLKKRLRYLDKFLGNDSAPFKCFNNNNDAQTRKTDKRYYRSEEMKPKCLLYSANHNKCIACKTSYLIGKIQLLRQLLGEVGLQEKSHKTRSKGIRSPKYLPSPDQPQMKKAQTKLLGNSPLCIQEKLDLQPTYYQKNHRPLECACDWFYKTLDYPVMATQRHQCTPKCFQNLLDYLHIHRQGKGFSSTRSKRIRTQTMSNCPVICSWVKCKKNQCKQTKRQLSPQDNLMPNSDRKGKKTNLSKGGIKLNCSNCKKKKICSPKKEKKARFLINNKEKTPQRTDQKNAKKRKDKRRQERTNCPLCMHKRCSPKKKRKKNMSKCKCSTKKIAKKDKMKIKGSPQAKAKRSRSPKDKDKKKNMSKSKKRNTKIISKKRIRTFPICLVDLVQTMRQAEAKAWPLDVDCECLYIQTLKKKPCLWIYKLRPSIYPRFLRLLRLTKRIGTFLILCLCSPLLSCSYCCFEIITSCIEAIICCGC